MRIEIVEELQQKKKGRRKKERSRMETIQKKLVGAWLPGERR